MLREAVGADRPDSLPVRGAIETLDRGLLFALPVLFVILAAELVDAVIRAPQWTWNEVRLARSFALRYGYPLYPGHDPHGPVIGTLHTPVSHLLYATLSFLKNPTTAVLAGATLSAFICLAALLWIHVRTGGPRIAAFYGFLAAATIALTSPGVRYGAVNIHVDAAAWCCAILAAGMLVFSSSTERFRAYAGSAIFGVLAVGCKQTMAPVPVALACFVLIAAGPRAFLRYVLMQCAATALIASAILLAFGPAREVVFNTWTLAGGLPHSSENGGALRGIFELREEIVCAAPALTLLLLRFFLARGGIRPRLAQHPWIVFVLMAAFQLPFALRGWTTAGGSTNHLGTVVLFLALAATTGLTALWRAGTTAAEPFMAFTARVLLLAILVARMYVPWQLPQAFATLHNNPAETAFRYEKAHAGRAYFPENPLAVLLAGGGLRHFDWALFDREQAGVPLTPQQFAAAVPPHYELIAWPSAEVTPASSFVLQQLAHAHAVTDPELKGWHVCRITR